MDRAHAAVLARAQLAESIKSKLEKSIQSQGAWTQSGTSASSSSKMTQFVTEVAQETVVNSQIIRTATHRNSDGLHVCVLIWLDQSTSRDAVAAAAKRSGLSKEELPPIQDVLDALRPEHIQ
jgi:hypothetical protein